MKLCQNCRAIHPDSYAGQCPHCGAPMGLAGGADTGPVQQGNALGDGSRAALTAIRDEQAIRGGRYEDVQVPRELLASVTRMLGGDGE